MTFLKAKPLKKTQLPHLEQQSPYKTQKAVIFKHHDFYIVFRCVCVRKLMHFFATGACIIRCSPHTIMPPYTNHVCATGSIMLDFCYHLCLFKLCCIRKIMICVLLFVVHSFANGCTVFATMCYISRCSLHTIMPPHTMHVCTAYSYYLMRDFCSPRAGLLCCWAIWKKHVFCRCCSCCNCS